MSRALVRTATAVAGTTLAVTTAMVGTATAAPSPGDGVPTFQEFVDSTYQDDDRGFVVNGDEPATSTGALRQFYDAMVTEPDTPSTASSSTGSRALTTSGRRARRPTSPTA